MLLFVGLRNKGNCLDLEKVPRTLSAKRLIPHAAVVETGQNTFQAEATLTRPAGDPRRGPASLCQQPRSPTWGLPL